jgi:dGTPase
VRQYPERLVAFSEAVDTERRQAKKFLYQNLYYSDTLRPEKQHAEVVVTALFEYYFGSSNALPFSYHEAFSRDAARVVCDYIAGMTDNFILAQYEQLVANPSLSKGVTVSNYETGS